MVSDAKIFESLNEQVVKYPARNLEKFKSRLIQVLTDRDLIEALKRAARKCIEENSASKIAERYLTLFTALKES
jgi:glycosyltransferase involved in cell wall biosynthesis